MKSYDGALLIGLIPLQEEEEVLEHSVSLHMHRENATCGHNQKVAICDPGRDSSPKPNHDGTLISDF